MTNDPHNYGDVNPFDAALTWLSDGEVVPYFGYALHSLVPIRRPGLKTCATDMYGRLYYDEEWMRQNTVQENATVLVHELWHNLNQHGPRGERMPKLKVVDPGTGNVFSMWNVAGDEAINSMMKAEMQGGYDYTTGRSTKGLPWKFPQGCVFPETFGHPDGLLEEEYMKLHLAGANITEAPTPYEGDEDDEVLLPGESANSGNEEDGDADESDGGEDDGEDADSEEEGEGEQDSQGVGESEDAGADASPSDDGGDGDDVESPDGDFNEEYEGPPSQVMSGGCGSSATGETMPWELPAPDADDPEVPEGLSESDIEQIARETAEAILEASANQGNIPGGMRRWAENKLHVKISWEQVLMAEARRHFTAAKGKIKRTYERRNRRQGMVEPKIILPGVVHPGINAAMVVDTSGSMSEEYLEQAIDLVGRAARVAGNIGITVIPTDAAVGTVQRIRTPSQTVVLDGGGGTDMTVGIDHALSQVKPKPDVVIVFTDGITGWPREAPKVGRLLIVLIGPAAYVGKGGTYRNRVPDWAHRIVEVVTDER